MPCTIVPITDLDIINPLEIKDVIQYHVNGRYVEIPKEYAHLVCMKRRDELAREYDISERDLRTLLCEHKIKVSPKNLLRIEEVIEVYLVLGWPLKMHKDIVHNKMDTALNAHLKISEKMNRVIFIVAAAILLPTARYLLRPVKAPQHANMNGPIFYGITSGGALYKVDVMNCTACPIANLTNGVAYDVLILPNGDVLVQSALGLYRYTLPSNTPIWSETNAVYAGSVLAPNGTIYLARSFPTDGLATYDPATNTITYIGDWPADMQIAEFFHQNGVLYGFGSQSGSDVLVEINTTNPELSTVIYSSGLNINSGGTTNNGYTTANGASNDDMLYQYNVNTNTFDFICDLDAFISGGSGFSGLSDLPAGAPEAPCLCITFAGAVTGQTINVCVPGSVTVPYNNNATLDGNDILRYILFSDPADTLGSIIVQSSSATIAFNPVTMQTGIAYYLATVAGDDLGGNVDLNDPCIDVSNTAAQVIWREQPAVAFSVANPDICVGECVTVTATFTGIPPFTLTYTTPAGTFTEGFSVNMGTIFVCVPAGTPAGPLQIQAVSLTDAWCACQ